MSTLILRCISSEKFYITVGKIYEATICTPYAYMLQDDVNITVVVDRHQFEDISEVRSNKLRELGI